MTGIEEGKNAQRGMNMPSRKSGDLARRLWNLCHILRGDGVGYTKYVSELTYLLFLKIAAETGTEAELPEGCRWRDLIRQKDSDLLIFYRDMLTYLGGHAKDPIVREIFAFPTTEFSHSENLRSVIDGMASLDWHRLDTDGIGDLYESLLARSSQDARSGAGQYFTPRPLVDTLVSLIRPRGGETVLDPACGSGGFLIAAHRAALAYDGRPARIEGVEIEKNTFRLCRMNAFLHELNAILVRGDALTEDAALLSPADVVLANPPFGTRSGSSRRMRPELPRKTSNKQLAFLQAIRLGLRQNGRAAVIVPDGVLFEAGVGRHIRKDLIADCDLHTVLRLPNGIFYSPGIQTNVLFFTRRSGDRRNSETVWFYDLRTAMPSFGRTRPLGAKHLQAFATAYGEDPHGRSPERVAIEDPRWRAYPLDEITSRDFDLNLSWLEESEQAPAMTGIDDHLAMLILQLQEAMAELETLADGLAIDGSLP